MLNIVVPMAGRGSRFFDAGYEMPKPLIDINGHPMIEYVVKSITPNQDHRFIFICQEEHIQKYHLDITLNAIAPSCTIIPITYITEGAACTVLLAEQYINVEAPLMIANSDQYVDVDINDYVDSIRENDGLIMTMPANHPKWSYIQFDNQGYVTLVREKEVISNEATVGIYNFARGNEFVEFAHQMIRKNIRVNNEFYVAPIYNEMIASGKKIVFKNVGDKMHGLGVPEDLEKFLDTSYTRIFS